MSNLFIKYASVSLFRCIKAIRSNQATIDVKKQQIIPFRQAIFKRTGTWNQGQNKDPWTKTRTRDEDNDKDPLIRTMIQGTRTRTRTRGKEPGTKKGQGTGTRKRTQGQDQGTGLRTQGHEQGQVRGTRNGNKDKNKRQRTLYRPPQECFNKNRHNLY